VGICVLHFLRAAGNFPGTLLKSLPEIFTAKKFENFLGLLAARQPEKFSD